MPCREVRSMLSKLVAKYAEKRAALKQIVRTGDPAEAFEAAQKLQELPKNSNPIRPERAEPVTNPLLIVSTTVGR